MFGLKRGFLIGGSSEKLKANGITSAPDVVETISRGGYQGRGRGAFQRGSFGISSSTFSSNSMAQPKWGNQGCNDIDKKEQNQKRHDAALQDLYSDIASDGQWDNNDPPYPSTSMEQNLPPDDFDDWDNYFDKDYLEEEILREQQEMEAQQQTDPTEDSRNPKPKPHRFTNCSNLLLKSDGLFYTDFGDEGFKEVPDLRNLRHCFIGTLTVTILNGKAIEAFDKVAESRTHLNTDELVINGFDQTESDKAKTAHLQRIHQLLDELINANELYFMLPTWDLKLVMENKELTHFTEDQVQRVAVTGTPVTNSDNFFDVKLVPLGIDLLMDFIFDPNVKYSTRHLLNLMSQFEPDGDYCERILDLFNRHPNPVTIFRIIQIWTPISYSNKMKEFASRHSFKLLPDPTEEHDFTLVVKRTPLENNNHADKDEVWYLKATMRWMEMFRLYELKFHVLQKIGPNVLCSPMCNCDATVGVETKSK